MKQLILALSLACVVIATGCSGQQGTEPVLSPVDAPSGETAGADASATAGTDAADAGRNAPEPITEDSPIWFEPASVQDCVASATGVIHWNASSFPDVKVVRVALPGKDGEEGVFAVSGSIGQKETGPWLVAGSEVILRDNESGRELARATMPGVPCQE